MGNAPVSSGGGGGGAKKSDSNETGKPQFIFMCVCVSARYATIQFFGGWAFMDSFICVPLLMAVAH